MYWWCEVREYYSYGCILVVVRIGEDKDDLRRLLWNVEGKIKGNVKFILVYKKINFLNIICLL